MATEDIGIPLTLQRLYHMVPIQGHATHICIYTYNSNRPCLPVKTPVTLHPTSFLQPEYNIGPKGQDVFHCCSIYNVTFLVRKFNEGALLSSCICLTRA